MAPFKKNLTPLKPRGQIDAHKGKGSEMAPLPDRGQISKLTRNPAANSINDYGKATPVTPPPSFGVSDI